MDFQTDADAIEESLGDNFIKPWALARSIKLKWLVAGIAVGAVSVYYLDPQLGHRRRVLLRDKSVRFKNDVAWYARRWSHYLTHWIQGVPYKVGYWRPRETPS